MSITKNIFEELEKINNEMMEINKGYRFQVSGEYTRGICGDVVISLVDEGYEIDITTKFWSSENDQEIECLSLTVTDLKNIKKEISEKIDEILKNEIFFVENDFQQKSFIYKRTGEKVEIIKEVWKKKY